LDEGHGSAGVLFNLNCDHNNPWREEERERLRRVLGEI